MRLKMTRCWRPSEFLFVYSDEGKEKPVVAFLFFSASDHLLLYYDLYDAAGIGIFQALMWFMAEVFEYLEKSSRNGQISLAAL